MNDETNKLLEDIKKLLILQLDKSGATKHEIGETIGVSYKTIERMLPKVRKSNKDNK